LEPNRTLSHYRLIEKIGEGGMGVVWKAEDTVLGRTVAVKVLPADLARDEQRRKMFLDEARLASSVSEAHIVQVFEFGREGDLDFIVMAGHKAEALRLRRRARDMGVLRMQFRYSPDLKSLGEDQEFERIMAGIREFR
jgi:serine/threonine-protein kinase